MGQICRILNRGSMRKSGKQRKKDIERERYEEEKKERKNTHSKLFEIVAPLGLRKNQKAFSLPKSRTHCV
jgi:hypothetical protein